MAHLMKNNTPTPRPGSLGTEACQPAGVATRARSIGWVRGGTKTGLDSIYRKCFQSFASHCEAARNPGFLLQHQLHRRKGCTTLCFQPEFGLLIVFIFGQMTKVQLAGTWETALHVFPDTNYHSVLGQRQG